MIATTKANIINKYREPIKVSTYYLHKSGKYMVEEVSTEPVYYCKIGDEVGLISRNFSIGGWFYVVINKKDETFLIDEKDIDCDFHFLPQSVTEKIPNYRMNTHKFTDFQEFNFF